MKKPVFGKSFVKLVDGILKQSDILLKRGAVLEKCILCDRPTVEHRRFDHHSYQSPYFYFCDCCGTVFYEKKFIDHGINSNDISPYKYILSGYYREMKEKGVERPIVLDFKDYMKILEYPYPKTVTAKQNRLLKYFGDVSEYPGSKISQK